MKIAIVGGGIGGLTTALALRQFGFESEVFEQAPELLEVGAAIAMWPNALRVLQRLGIADQVIENAGVIEQVRWINCDGKSLNRARLPIKDVPAVALHRADLQRVLLHALPGTSIHLGHDFVAYERHVNGIRVNFANQASFDCDALIGADGLHSQVREQMVDARGPLYRGYTVWRGISSCVPEELETATAIEIHGRGQRFGIGPVGHGRMGWWASANEGDDCEEPDSEQQKLLQLFAGWWAPVRRLIETTPAASILRNKAYDREPTRSWGVGRITLLGDAIHPTTPNLGQGGCMAIEDAAVLTRCLAKTNELAHAFRAYERVRHARTAAIANASRLYGAVGQWESRVGVWSRGVMLSLIPDAVTRQVLRLVFDYDAFGVRI